MVAPGPIRFDDLSEAHQKLLLEYGTDFADRVMRRYRWRGTPNGVPPEGYDPSSVAAEAVAQLLSRSHARRARCSKQTTPASTLSLDPLLSSTRDTAQFVGANSWPAIRDVWLSRPHGVQT